MEIIHNALMAGLVLSGGWTTYEIYSVFRQRLRNWIDETAHPVERSPVLQTVLKALGMSESDTLTASVSIACFLMAWPISWIGLIVTIMAFRARAKRRLAKQSVTSVVSTTQRLETTNMVHIDLHNVESARPLSAKM